MMHADELKRATKEVQPVGVPGDKFKEMSMKVDEM